MEMRWLYDVDDYFFTCSCPGDKNIKCALNLIRLGSKDWLRLVTSSYAPEQRVAVTWERFSEMCRTRYDPLVERERLTQEYMDLMQMTESVMKITKMFTKRALFVPKFAASD